MRLGAHRVFGESFERSSRDRRIGIGRMDGFEVLLGILSSADLLKSMPSSRCESWCSVAIRVRRSAVSRSGTRNRATGAGGACGHVQIDGRPVSGRQLSCHVALPLFVGNVRIDGQEIAFDVRHAL